MAEPGIVIVGGGQAAYQLVASLRDEGYGGSIRLLGAELHLPYQRPPLSKSYMSGEVDAASLQFQAHAYYARHDVQVATGTRVTRIDRAGSWVETSAGEHVPYAHLVLATGARNRELPCATGLAHGVFGLRSLDDARAIREQLGALRRVVVIGAGFLGLEFAAVAAAKGVAVTVVEASATLMSRVVCEPVGHAFQHHHEALGVRFILGTTVARIRTATGKVVGVETTDGREAEGEAVVVSIGVHPNSELAAEAGLPTRNGVVVDRFLATEDPRISAIGDCASFPSRFADAHSRLESIQNANDQARCLARRLAGRPQAYDAVPWFWSDQAGLKLQIAGLSAGADEVVLRGDQAGCKFSAYRFGSSRLLAVESVNRPADHMLARKLLTSAAPLTPDQVRDESFDLKRLLAMPAAAT